MSLHIKLELTTAKIKALGSVFSQELNAEIQDLIEEIDRLSDQYLSVWFLLSRYVGVYVWVIISIFCFALGTDTIQFSMGFVQTSKAGTISGNGSITMYSSDFWMLFGLFVKLLWYVVCISTIFGWRDEERFWDETFKAVATFKIRNQQRCQVSLKTGGCCLRPFLFTIAIGELRQVTVPDESSKIMIPGQANNSERVNVNPGASLNVYAVKESYMDAQQMVISGNPFNTQGAKLKR